MVTTKTLGPLHLEDLEPHRFEDLARQLIYDFRNWRALEATGRSGSDDGFDARGIEVSATDISTEEDNQNGQQADRVWLIQCKREKSITPKKLQKYLRDISEIERTSLYGLIFIGACDFSKKARDTFREVTRDLGVSEAYILGKGEIEDLLYQPKNDHLLFAYFGVSLQTRQKSIKTQIRSRLSIKRKADKTLSPHQEVLIRDSTDTRYPFLDPDISKNRFERGRWHVLTYEGIFHDGLHFIIHKHFGYLSDDGTAWDFAETMDDGQVPSFQNPWRDKNKESAQHQDREIPMKIWNELPPENKGWFEVVAVLPFDHVIDIDEDGDDRFEGPHIYTIDFSKDDHPFIYFLEELTAGSQWNTRWGNLETATRTNIFPRKPENSDA